MARDWDAVFVARWRTPRVRRVRGGFRAALRPAKGLFLLMFFKWVHRVRDVFPIVLVSGRSSGREARSRGTGKAAATAAAGGGLRCALGVEAERDSAVSTFVDGLLSGPGLARGNGGGIARGDGNFVEFGSNRGDAP